MTRFAFATALAGGSLFCAAAPANAGGFFLQEQSPRDIGRATAGDAAAADSPATIFFNPAGMTELEGFQVDSGLHVLFVESRQRNRGTTLNLAPPATPAPVSLPVSGGDGGNPFDVPTVVPSGYASYQVSDRLWLGLGVSSPYGLVVDYQEGEFFGRYDSIRSSVFTINVQPSIAFKVNDAISVGAGVDVQYLEVDLTSAVPVPGGPDGRILIEGDDISFGWNAGVMVDLGAVRLGAHYRSEVVHDVEGTFNVTGTPADLQVAALAPVTLPDLASFSIVVAPRERTRFYGSFRYYDWSDFDRIEVQREGLPTLLSPQNYDDTWSAAVAVEHDVSERLTLRLGTMYDETPTRDEFRTTRVPDGDRTWIAGGVTYGLAEHFDISLSYAHVFVSEEEIDRTDPLSATASSTIRSTNSGNVDQVAAAVTARF